MNHHAHIANRYQKKKLLKRLRDVVIPRKAANWVLAVASVVNRSALLEIPTNKQTARARMTQRVQKALVARDQNPVGSMKFSAINSTSVNLATALALMSATVFSSYSSSRYGGYIISGYS
jgi:hypothetical protein